MYLQGQRQPCHGDKSHAALPVRATIVANRQSGPCAGAAKRPAATIKQWARNIAKTGPVFGARANTIMLKKMTDAHLRVNCVKVVKLHRREESRATNDSRRELCQATNGSRCQPPMEEYRCEWCRRPMKVSANCVEVGAPREQSIAKNRTTASTTAC